MSPKISCALSTKWNMKRRNNACDEEWPLPPVKTPTPHLNSGSRPVNRVDFRKINIDQHNDFDCAGAFIGFGKELRKLLKWSAKEYNATVAELQQNEVDPYKYGVPPVHSPSSTLGSNDLLSSFESKPRFYRWPVLV